MGAKKGYAYIAVGLALIIILTPFCSAYAVFEQVITWWIIGSGLIIFGVYSIRKAKRERT